MRAKDAGIWFVAAAGNDGVDIDTRPQYPASYNLENMITVTAHDTHAKLASFASFGKKSVDISAPGVDIISTITNGHYDVMSGTSMATPLVSGILGLYLAQQKESQQDRKTLNFASIKARLAATSTPIKSMSRKTKSGGIVNAYNFLTDTRPERAAAPDPLLWQKVKLPHAFASEHPYPNRIDSKITIRLPAARYLRVKVKQFDLEENYDYVIFSHPDDGEIDRLTGIGENYLTDYVEGDRMVVQLVSDSSKNQWGYLIEEVEAIY